MSILSYVLSQLAATHVLCSLHAALPDLRGAAQLSRAAEVQQEQLHCHRGGWRQGDSGAPHSYQQQPGACREGRRHASNASLSCSRHTRQHQLLSTCQVLANGPPGACLPVSTCTLSLTAPSQPDWAARSSSKGGSACTCEHDPHFVSLGSKAQAKRQRHGRGVQQFMNPHSPHTSRQAGEANRASRETVRTTVLHVMWQSTSGASA